MSAVAYREGRLLREGHSPLLRAHRPRGEGLCFCVGGRCLREAAAERGPDSSRCGPSGQRETGCLSMPVVPPGERTSFLSSLPLGSRIRRALGWVLGFGDPTTSSPPLL